jgi:Mrp family chromosome partitioning ATPase
MMNKIKKENIKHIIGIVSGKGGVGKSYVTGSIAVELAKQGYRAFF